MSGYCQITCGSCGATHDFEEFCRTPISGPLPRGQYQCPSCLVAWRMNSIGDGKWYPSGLYVPPDQKAVPVPAVL